MNAKTYCTKETLERRLILSEMRPERALERFNGHYQRVLDETAKQNTINGFEEKIEFALANGQPTIEVDTSTAEALSVILKSRRKERGGQPKSRYEDLRRRALLDYARSLKRQFEEEENSATDAREMAAEQVAELAKELGARLSAKHISNEI